MQYGGKLWYSLMPKCHQNFHFFQVIFCLVTSRWACVVVKHSLKLVSGICLFNLYRLLKFLQLEFSELYFITKHLAVVRLFLLLNICTLTSYNVILWWMCYTCNSLCNLVHDQNTGLVPAEKIDTRTVQLQMKISCMELRTVSVKRMYCCFFSRV